MQLAVAQLWYHAMQGMVWASRVALSANPLTPGTAQGALTPHSEAARALRDHAEDGETHPQRALSVRGLIDVHGHLSRTVL